MADLALSHDQMRQLTATGFGRSTASTRVGQTKARSAGARFPSAIRRAGRDAA